MNKIYEFLKERPLISIRALEQSCSIPLGTIRLNGKRDIPDKYEDILIKKLTPYGFIHKDLLKAISIDLRSIQNLIDDNT